VIKNFRKKIKLLELPESNITAFLVSITIWIAVFIIMFGLGILLGLLPDEWFAVPDRVTSWITTLLNVGCGVMAAVNIYKIDRKLAFYTSVACATLFSCYFGYVTVEWGDAHPHLSANGYNLGTSMVWVLVLLLSEACRKVGYKRGIS
jgi:hypothetical protein